MLQYLQYPLRSCFIIINEMFAYCGIAQNDRVRWYNIYSGSEHELVGKVQLFLSYTVTSGEVDSAKVNFLFTRLV